MSLPELKQDPPIIMKSPSGFRLHKLEVFNWGTFDDKVWTFFPHGETALLTGDVGSGKSTLVDALTTLLVPPRKVAYNKAADSEAKERTVMSYVRGYFGQKRGEDGAGQPDCLRDVSHYSVLLATFTDKSLSQSVTLAQFFWFQKKDSPSRFYVVADKELSIIKDFSKFGRDTRNLKKRLKNDKGIQVFDDYNRYSGIFRGKLGIDQERALDLFQQTISMKKVEALTAFVRANMLENPDTMQGVRKLIEHFHDLNSAHEAVVKARDQIQKLKPVIEKGKRYDDLENEQDLLEEASRALRHWIARQVVVLQAENILHLRQVLDLAIKKLEQADIVQNDIDHEIQNVERKIGSSGGDALKDLEREIQLVGKELQTRAKARTNYEHQAKILSLPLPNSLESFESTRQKLSEQKSDEQDHFETLQNEYANVLADKNKSDAELEKVEEELTSLRSRQSSIPRVHIEKRKQLCQTLSINDKELPFVGELLEVRTGEEEWEGAIERLLHSFALSLLVPEKYYAAVSQWVDRSALGMRLVYYRIHSEAARPFTSQPNPLAVSEKLNMKPDTPFGIWLTREIRQRFSYICCDRMEQFHRESQAITKAGQIKSHGTRHEKDDRYRINDRRRFVLGFSNQRKINALESSRNLLLKDIQLIMNKIQDTISKQRESQQCLNALNILDGISEFSEIDVFSTQNELERKREQKNRLEKENDILQALQDQLIVLNEKKLAQKRIFREAQEHELNAKNQLKNACNEKEQAQKRVDQEDPVMHERAYPYLEQNKTRVWQHHTFSLSNATKLEQDYSDWFESRRSDTDKKINSLSNDIVKMLTEYRHQYSEETREVDSDIKALPEYKRMLERLEKDGLPKFEVRFKQLLHENTINQIALFQAKLKMEQDTIKRRIEQINASLNTIDYNEGRYIRLEYDETYDSDIKSFRMQLRSCTEGALTGSEDEQYTEAKFMQVKEIIGRFRGREGEIDSDGRWTKKVVDVRNWFLFAASERWRENDEEYEHYTDSGGKSGGQKEKLAYTILAASLVYHFGLEDRRDGNLSFRFVVIDEAFLKSSDESARFGLQLFKKLDLQLLIVTPLLKIPTIAQFIAHVGFVHHNDVRHQSMLRNISIEEYERERRERELMQSV